MYNFFFGKTPSSPQKGTINMNESTSTTPKTQASASGGGGGGIAFPISYALYSEERNKIDILNAINKQMDTCLQYIQLSPSVDERAWIEQANQLRERYSYLVNDLFSPKTTIDTN